MTDVSLYQSQVEQYEKIQQKRPDYNGAIKAAVVMAEKSLADKGHITVVDFCGGTGLVSHRIARVVPAVEKIHLIDFNPAFLDIAEHNITDVELEIQCVDILEATLRHEADIVLALFAYHHIPHAKKMAFLEQVKAAAKPGAIIILGEIYLPDQPTIEQYYQLLVNEIPADLRDEPLLVFLAETAMSKDFEFKVSRDFAKKQFDEAGLTLIDSKKIWPLDDRLPADCGAYVECYKLTV